MQYVELDRKFSRWRDETSEREGFRLFERDFYGNMCWKELLQYQRVIILAEAGSGKSRELEEQARKLREQDEFVFHATVRNVAEESLAGALGVVAREKLEAWRNSEATGWFFIDSVDEAKLDHIRFVDALQKLGDGLGNGLPRARIILSGRYSDWEFRADLQRVNEVLPIAKHKDTQLQDPAEVLTSILRSDTARRSDESILETALVVLMAPLDKDQVHLFARCQGVQQPEEFMKSLAEENLWNLAKRPLDLSWLVDYWLKNRRFKDLAICWKRAFGLAFRRRTPSGTHEMTSA